MPESLLDRLAAHRTLASVPRPQLEWLAAVGEERTLGAGDILTPGGVPVKGLYVVLSGHLSIRVDRGAGPRIVMEWYGGDVTGILPYSRIKGPPASVVAEEPSDILAVSPDEMQRMIVECHELTSVLVHVMIDRARVFKSSELLDEKVASLGRLAAGLAHELNNPASAVARSAKTLVAGLASLDHATARFTALNLTPDQVHAVAALPDDGSQTAAGSLECADRQDAIDDWLAAHDVRGVESEALARSGLEPAALDTLASAVGAHQVGAVLAHESAQRAVRQLAREIETAATRIHTLVAAVKGFTYVNQQATLMPIAIGQGLADTITVLRSKARSKSVAIELRVAEQLPAVEGYGGELNQVWANLVDNAIDATPGGRVRIEAEGTGRSVVVRVVDDGPGIPADVAGRIFDPFFTTKDVGAGAGLGLDIARRIVQRHHGVIDMSTSERGTEFRVTLPAAGAPGAGV